MMQFDYIIIFEVGWNHQVEVVLSNIPDPWPRMIRE